MLTWVLDRQFATLLVAILTLIVTVVLYIAIPKGFFPVQDTGAIQGISESRADRVVRGDERAPAGPGRSRHADPAVGEPVVVHRRRRHQRDARTAAAC
jgi:multidrug efflux pump